MADALSWIKTAAEWVLLATALLGAYLAWGKVVRPALAERTADRAQRQAVQDVLLGRPAIPANPITGEPAKPARPAIGQQVADLADVVAQLDRKVDDIHHELHPNKGTSMKDAVGRTEAGVGAVAAEVSEIRDRLRDGDHRFDDQAERLGRIESVLAGELALATDTIANAAEASATALRVIDVALHTDPPAALAAGDPPPDLD